MKCQKCGSDNVTATAVVEHSLEKKKPGAIWWVLVGWWWVPLKWIFLTLPAIVVKIFKPKNYEMKAKTRTVFTCLDCGNTWEF